MRTILAILFLCASTFLAKGIDANAVHYRAAGVDVPLQKYYLQWSYPNITDTAEIQSILVLKLKTDALQNIIIDTLDIVPPSATRYLDYTSPCCTPNIYTIKFIPKLGSSFGRYENPFRTMLLSEPTLDTCANAINLQWSPYQKLDKYTTTPTPDPAFANEVSYHIYGYVGGSTFKPDSAVWLASSGKDTSLALPLTQEKKYYHLYVAAVYNGGADTSYSNRVQIFTPLLIRPRYISIDSVLCDEQGATLRFGIDPGTEYARFWAEQSADANGPFTPFEEFNSKYQRSARHQAQGSAPTFYRVSAVNSCSVATASSPVAASISATVSNRGSVNTITWNEVTYDGYSAAYSVYRATPSALAGWVGSTQHSSITDDLSVFPDSAFVGADICYRIEAISENEQGQAMSFTRSARVCHSIIPDFFMPNAIQLNSSATNPATGKSRNLFEPVSSYSLRYMLYVYSRNGKLLYGGSSPWNGRENNVGNFVGQGSYVYYIKITFANGEHAEKTGNVTVVY